MMRRIIAAAAPRRYHVRVRTSAGQTRRTTLRVLVTVTAALTLRAGALAQPDALCPIVENGKWGWIDASGRVVAKPTFDALAPYRSGLVGLLPGAPGSVADYLILTDSWSMKGPPLRIPWRADRIGVRINGKWGFADRDGNIVVEPRFDALYSYRGGRFQEGLIPVRIGKLWGYADDSGRLVLSAQYDTAYDFQDGLALVKRGGQWFVIDRAGAQLGMLPSGGEVGPSDWETSGELVPIQFDRRWGAINRRGALVIPPEFDTLRPPQEGLMTARVGEKWGYVDLTGKFVIAPRFEKAQGFSNGRAEVWIDKQFALIDRTGAIVAGPYRFAIFNGFFGPAAWFQQGQQFGLIDRDGRITVKPRFSDADLLFNGEGLSWVKERGKCGYVDATGQFVIAAKFERCQQFSEGLAAVILTGRKWGYIDTRGEFVIPAQFDLADVFTAGLARVEHIDRKRLITDFSYIDTRGRVVYKMRFTGIG